jgi:hypothetical protein
LPLDVRSYVLSDDDARIAMETGSREVVVVDTSTARNIGRVPSKPAQRLVWLDPDGSRLIVRDGDQGKYEKGGAIELWDVGGSALLRRFDLAEEDRLEAERDTALLERSPSATALREIAQRRLRACPADLIPGR